MSENTTVIAGRTISKGLSMKYCMEREIKPSALKPELNNPIFDDWNFLLRTANMGIIEGEPFTEEDGALWIITASMIVLVGDPSKNKTFLEASSESLEEKQPS